MIGIGLINPKFDANIGGAMRACACYYADLVLIEAHRNHKAVKGQAADTPKAWRHIPTIFTDDIFQNMPVGAVPVAVDLLEDAECLYDFKHPKNALYIFGAEDSTLNKNITDRCVHKIYIPTKCCMNLAATVNVVLYDRLRKQNVS